jgi:hypothetical protein
MHTPTDASPRTRSAGARVPSCHFVACMAAARHNDEYVHVTRNVPPQASKKQWRDKKRGKGMHDMWSTWVWYVCRYAVGTRAVRGTGTRVILTQRSEACGVCQSRAWSRVTVSLERSVSHSTGALDRTLSAVPWAPRGNRAMRRTLRAAAIALTPHRFEGVEGAHGIHAEAACFDVRLPPSAAPAMMGTKVPVPGVRP